MSGAGFTPGPWYAERRMTVIAVGSAAKSIANVSLLGRAGRNGSAEANARLIAAAPDHADIGWAMCVAAGRWEPWGDERGEFVIHGLRFTTKLDEFGVPEVTLPLRVQIAKARGEQQ